MNAHRNNSHFGEYLALALMIISIGFLLFSLPYNAGSVDTEGEARRVGRQVSQRMIKLEAYMQEALTEPEESWLELVSLPEDMVIYKYVDDTLRSWCNQFSLKNDDISHRMVYPMFANPKAQYESPLTAVTAEPALICMGPKWYLAKGMVRDGTEVIGGLELVDENNRRLANRVNRRLKLPARYAIRPLSYSGGTTVELDGRPVFKVMSESLQRDPLKHSAFIWISYACSRRPGCCSSTTGRRSGAMRWWCRSSWRQPSPCMPGAAWPPIRPAASSLRASMPTGTCSIRWVRSSSSTSASSCWY